MGARSRTKGAAWEREVGHKIEAATGVKAVRTLSECRDGNVGDIQCPDLPIVWQAKVGARPDIYGAVREATEVAEPKGLHPVAIVKRNGSRHQPADELAILPLDDFLEIVGTMKRLGVW